MLSGGHLDQEALPTLTEIICHMWCVSVAILDCCYSIKDKKTLLRRFIFEALRKLAWNMSSAWKYAFDFNVLKKFTPILTCFDNTIKKIYTNFWHLYSKICLLPLWNRKKQHSYAWSQRVSEISSTWFFLVPKLKERWDIDSSLIK